MKEPGITTETNPCVSCGHCCANMIIGVTPIQRSVFEKALEKCVEYKGNVIYSHDPTNHMPFGVFIIDEDCPFLERSLEGTVKCKIYKEETRPSACRNFKEGSDECNRIRSDNGLPPIDAA